MSDIDAFRQQSSAPNLPLGTARGIGGWLILPMLGLLLSPVVAIVVVLGRAVLLSKVEAIAPDLGTIVLSVVVAYAVLGILAPVALLFPFFGKRRIFRVSYVVLLAAQAIVVLVDAILTQTLLADLYRESGTPVFDAITIALITFAAIGVVIWIPYALGSLRAQNTFVN